MFKKITAWAVVALICCFSTSAQLVQKGPRPRIDFNAFPEAAFQKGIINIKLTPEAAALMANKKGGSITSGELFGIPELDDLCERLGVVSASSFYYNNGALKTEFSERHKKWGFDRWYSLITTDTDHTIRVVSRLGNQKKWIEVSEPEIKTEMNSWIPNDPYFSYQWHYHNTGQSGGTVDADIDLPEAWDIEKGNPAILVNIIDGGIDTTHQDLKRNLWVGTNERYGYNFTANSPVLTRHYHGTHVAGTVGAVNNNGIGVCGVAGGDSSANSGIRMINSQIFSKQVTSARAVDIVNSFIYGADHDAIISQNSWGNSYPGLYSIAQLDAIDYFIEYGGGSQFDHGLVVFSAGNDNQIWPHYPSAYSRVISVAATNNKDQKSSYSNYGRTVNIAAPGGEIQSGQSAGGVYSTDTVNGQYKYLQGTSMACPHVSGVAALVASKGLGRLSTDDIRSIIINEVDNIDSVNPGYVGYLGKGRLNAYKSLLKAVNVISKKNISPVTAFTVNKNACDSVSLAWSNNAQNDSVMVAVAVRAKALFGIPEGYYNVGDSIAGGGKVIFRGKASSLPYVFSDSLDDFVGFKIWAIDSGQYSRGIFSFFNYEPCDGYSGNIRYVKVGGVGNGTSWGNASGDVQKMINLAKEGDTIFVAAGTYMPTHPLYDMFSVRPGDRHNSFTIYKKITILGGFPANNNNATLAHRNWEYYQTILSGDIGTVNNISDNAYSVIFIGNGMDSVMVNIDGFIVEKGNANIIRRIGGGLVNYSNVTIRNVLFRNNRAEWGGGIINIGKMYLENVRFEDNYATNGGAIDNEGDSLFLKNVLIKNNSASYGGGVITYGETYTKLKNVSFINNSVINGGGGIYNYGNMDIDSVLFKKGNSKWGGAIYHIGTSLDAIGVLADSNTATNYGGALYLSTNNVRFNQSVLSNNVSNSGGALCQYGDNDTFEVLFTNVLMKNNTANYGSAVFLYYGHPEFISTAMVNNTAINDAVFYNNYSQPKLINVTMTGNGGYSSGGYYGASISYQPRLINSIIAENTVTNASYYAAKNDYNIRHNGVVKSIVGDSLLHNGSGNYVGGPVLNTNTFLPYLCGPAVNAGINDSLPAFITKDLAGNNRKFASIVDLGAYEVQKNSGTQYGTKVVNLCNGQSYTFNGKTYTSNNNTAKDTIVSVEGCDSIVTLNLTFSAYLTSTQPVNICNGESYVFNGKTYTTSTTVKDTFSSVGSCDSIVTLNLTVYPKYLDTVNAKICQGESYRFGDRTYTTSQIGLVDTLKSISGCDSTIVLNLSVYPKPAVTATSNAPVCEGRLLKIVAHGAQSYRWSGPGNFGGIGDSVVIDPVPGYLSGYYYIEGNTIDGCKDTFEIFIDIIPKPNVIVTTNLPVCSGDTLKLFGSGGDDYLWTGPNNFISTLRSPSIPNVTTAYSGNYALTVTDTTTTCIGDTSIFVRVNTKPFILNITGTKKSDDSYDFSAQGDVIGSDNYSWDFGDGATSNNPTPNHKYGQSGTYTVKLIVSNNCGSDTLTKVINYTPNGISDINILRQIVLYPNPANNLVVLKNLSNEKITSLTVYNLLGQQVEHLSVNALEAIQLNVSSYASGVYNIKVMFEQGEWGMLKFEIVK